MAKITIDKCLTRLEEMNLKCIKMETLVKLTGSERSMLGNIPDWGILDIKYKKAYIPTKMCFKRYHGRTWCDSRYEAAYDLMVDILEEERFQIFSYRDF